MESKTNNKSWKMLWRLTSEHRFKIFIALLLTAVAAICEMIPYWVIFQAINAILQSPIDPAARFYELSIWLAIALLLKTGLYAVAYALSHKAAYSILLDTRKTLVTHLAWAPLSWLQSRHSGQLKQSVLQDVENVENVIAHHTVEVFAALFGPLVVTSYLFWIDWRLALAALITAPLAIMTSALFMRNTGQQYDQFSAASAALESAMVEYIRNMPVVKIFRQDATNFQTMRQRLEDYYGVVRELTTKTIPGWSLFSSLLAASVFFILPLGTWLHANSYVSIQQVLMVIVLGSGMLKPLLKVSRFLMEINEVMAGLRRLEPVFKIETQQKTNKLNFKNPIKMEFDNTGFSYPNQTNNGTIKNFNLILKPGSFNVLLGPSGAGKSTIAQLSGGLLEPESGTIRLNNVSLQALSQQQRSTLIAIATQEVFLFQGSIKENLRLARPDATEQEIKRAVKAAQAETLISSLSNGYDTLITEQGVNLSGGERQRIAIARALLANTPILVLDEASAALDSITQQAFYQDVKTLYPDKTILMITHRAYGIESADQIVIMDKGNTKDIGKHSELLTRNSFYKRLWQQQSECESWSIGISNLQLKELVDG